MINKACGKNLVGNSPHGVGGAPPIAETIIEGSPVTQIDFTGLDIVADKSYRFELSIKADTGSPLLDLYINDDTTNANYRQKYFSFNHTTLAGNSLSEPRIVGFTTGSFYTVVGVIQLDADGRVQIMSRELDQIAGSAVANSYLRSTIKVVGVEANITKLSFIASVALSIAVGSTIRLYKGN